MSEWKDSTGYSQGERGKIEPTSWALTLSPELRISVTKGHRIYRGEWIMFCYGLDMKEVQLGLDDSQPAEVAQRAAIKKALDKARRLNLHLADADE
jgi:predicted DNA-binding helix-hairpin-helix protein